MWHMTGGGIWTFSQKFKLPSSYALGVKVFWRYFHKGRVTESMNHKGVCRTALTTPGLLFTRYNFAFHVAIFKPICFRLSKYVYIYMFAFFSVFGQYIIFSLLETLHTPLLKTDTRKRSSSTLMVLSRVFISPSLVALFLLYSQTNFK